MLQNILKYQSIRKFIRGVGKDVLKYIDKDKVCVVGLGENGVFYGEGIYQWLKKHGFNVNFTTINDDGEGLEDKKAKGRKVLMVDSHIITGKCYQTALKVLRSKRKKLGIKDIKCAVMHDLRGFADFVAERYLIPQIKLDRIDFEIIKFLLGDGKKSYTEIAQKIGLSSMGVKNRIDRLLEQKILAIKGLINLEKFYSVSANIGIAADNLTCQKLIKKLSQNPLVFNLMKVSGSNKDLIIDIVAPTNKVIEEFLDQEIRSEAGVKLIEVNTGDLPIVPKMINQEKFRPFTSPIGLIER